MNSNRARVQFLIIGLLATVLTGFALNNTYQNNKQRFEELTLDEFQELLRKKERFDSLAEAEKERRRTLHQAIVEHEDATGLLRTLNQYQQWLKTLNTGQRHELIEIEDPAELYSRIEQIRLQQKSKIFGMAGDFALPSNDLEPLTEWVQGFIQSNLEKIKSKTESRTRRWIAERSRNAQPWYLFYIHAERGNVNRDKMIDIKTVDDMADNLSDEAKIIIDQLETDEEKIKLAEVWIRNAVLAKIRPPVTDDRLYEFVRSLTPEERQRFDDLSPRTWRKQMEAYYYRKNRLE